jgi:hypothetical protein
MVRRAKKSIRKEKEGRIKKILLGIKKKKKKNFKQKRENNN